MGEMSTAEGGLIMGIVCVVCLIIGHYNNSWLPQGDISRCLDRVPTIVAGSVCYGILEYGAIGSYFQSQACQMDTRLNRHDEDSFQLNGDFFRLALTAGVLISTPLLDGVIYPTFRRVVGGEVSVGLKITMGYLCVMCAQMVASIIETGRRHAPVTNVESKCAPLRPDGSHIHASSMSAFWMFIPYFLCGVSEVLVFPTLQHVAYEGSPIEMRPLMQAFNAFAAGAMPNAFASVINRSLAAFVPNDLNQGNLPMVYAINCGIGVLGICVFWVISRASSVAVLTAPLLPAPTDAPTT